ncbi:metallophosphoesterase, MG_246/ family [Anaerohalosphaera lusitana]|uniref:Metallophosphoesterase, MG_246/ family n=1 Tax=Anaerohalosphaera lusitana TaxID=1936003 RepID=A0A1U9NPR1_9BACT|nr:TIGR00282 family metallophosphoesterase [Anaerohalosphaera lusitana]AQT69734.1 metallophosphoesterase, MG_246/ family [Anaerohalosphaera lusitana]
MKARVLCIGDIVGRPGRHILSQVLPAYVRDNNIDCVIANAENAAGGSGLTPQIYEKLLRYGVNLVTLGDHAYRKRDIVSTLETADNIVRPANLSPEAAGKDFAIYQTANGVRVAVITLIGRIFMKPADCPYARIDALLSKIQNQNLADVIFVEMHAEATSEKVAMGYYLDGKVACVFGTHTHIVTADETLRTKGTAYITDIGMTGAHESVLGRKTEKVIKAFRTQMPFPFEIATEDQRVSGIVVTVNSNTHLAESIERVQLTCSETDSQGYDSDDGRPDRPSII